MKYAAGICRYSVISGDFLLDVCLSCFGVVCRACFGWGVYGGMVGIQHFAYRVKVAGELVHVRCRRVPLRYNNDKRKKPLFSRGLSVCRHLFNSFSKLKSDEKNIEKRRLFH